MSSRLLKAHTVVIKVGSATLVDAESFALRKEWLAALAEDVAARVKAGNRLVIVSSGAVALARGVVPQLVRKVDGRVPLEAKQALAACGQIALMRAYQEAFAAFGIPVAQVLLTLQDSERRNSYLNACHTLQQLLEAGVVPIVNENDTVATTEMRVGDNDRLAGRVAEMVGAEALVLLSDIDGLYTADPRKVPEAAFIPEVTVLTPEIEAMAGGSGSHVGSGGMATKLAAAKIAMQAGCHMAIMQGAGLHPLKRLLGGERVTWFVSDQTPRSARKRWIAGSLHVRGRLVVDAGAEGALRKGASLLPVGVKALEGVFQRGEAVSVVSVAGKELARGLSAYSSEELGQIHGLQTAEIERKLGYPGRGVCIHRDDLVWVGEKEDGAAVAAG